MLGEQALISWRDGGGLEWKVTLDIPYDLSVAKAKRSVRLVYIIYSSGHAEVGWKQWTPICWPMRLRRRCRLEGIPRQFYTNEFKHEAVSLVVDGGLTVAEVSRRLSVSQQTLRNWIKKYRSDRLGFFRWPVGVGFRSRGFQASQRTGRGSTGEGNPKKGYGVPCKGAAGRYAMIEELRQEQGFPVVPMCRALGVSKSGYYVWRNRKPSARKQEDERLKVAIKAAHERGRGTYGPEKIQDELLEVEQVEVGINRIKRLRRELKIRCKQVKKYQAPTDSNPKMPFPPNLMTQDSGVAGPKRVWVA